MNIKLISTRDISKSKFNYSQVLLNGLAKDGGLYIPENFEKFSLIEIKKFKNLNYKELVFEIKKKLTKGFIDDENLKKLIDNAYTTKKFDVKNEKYVPIHKLENDIYLQNLSLGPTAAFKDLAMQILSEEINFELNKKNEKLIILGATSGDTGSAAEAAIIGKDRIKLFMLSPKIGMSFFQKAQMKNLSSKNIFNISIDGRFDDCQNLVKELKKDPKFSKLGALNSINWGRITSQIPHFFSGYLQIVENIGDEIDFVIPTGNFGNILSGFYAKKLGLPIRKLIVATNENNVIEKLFNTGIYEFYDAKITSSPSMDISVASNYERLLFEIFNKNPKKIIKYFNEFEKNGRVDLKDYEIDKNIFSQLGFYVKSTNHKNRINIIKEIYNKFNLVIDPHTANGVYVAQKFKKNDKIKMIVFQTALPVKFEETIKDAINFIPKREKRFENLENNKNKYKFYELENNKNKLSDLILKNF